MGNGFLRKHSSRFRYLARSSLPSRSALTIFVSDKVRLNELERYSNLNPCELVDVLFVCENEVLFPVDMKFHEVVKSVCACTD